MDAIERAKRMAKIARERDYCAPTVAHDRWHIVNADGEELELILTQPMPFDWVAARYPGAGITRA